MNFLHLFNKVLLELNYRPLTRDMVTSSAAASNFERIFKTEHLRILENLKRVNAEVCSSANWDFLCVSRCGCGGLAGTEHYDGDVGQSSPRGEMPTGACNLETPPAMPKIYTAQNAFGEPKINLEGPDDVSAIPEAYLDVLIYGATLKTKANPSHPKFGFWSASYTKALARMRAECKLDKKDVPHIAIGHPRRT